MEEKNLVPRKFHTILTPKHIKESTETKWSKSGNTELHIHTEKNIMAEIIGTNAFQIRAI